MASKRVIILGGGPAGLAAAFDLARHPDRFDITVYQLGWRLGGKCASGRNACVRDRNEEHGLHLPMGFYENFFDHMRQAYGELNRPARSPLREWTQAFRARHTLMLEERFGGGWQDWPFEFPDHHGVPGDNARAYVNGAPNLPRTDVATIIRRIVEFLQAHTVEFGDSFVRVEHTDADLRDLELLVALVAARIRRAFDSHGPDAADGLDEVLEALRLLLKTTWKLVERTLDRNFRLRKAWIMLELGYAFARGMLRILDNGRFRFSDIEKTELTAWLNDHSPLGALTQIARDSAPLRMVYELVFAYEDGDATRPNIAAGVAARGLTRLAIAYAGAVSYDLAAGMGETVVTAYYDAILKRAPQTTFEFFSRVKDLRLDNGRIASITIGVQAQPKNGAYVPTRRVNNVDVWGAEPDYDQLVEGDRLREGTELPGGGYDLEETWTGWQDVRDVVIDVDSDTHVVLAIPSSVLPCITSTWTEPTWRQMLERVTGAPTIAMQLWFDKTSEDLGLPPHRAGSKNEAPLVGAYADNLGTIADMTGVIDFESWQKQDPPPRSSLYFCGPFIAPATAPDCFTPASKYIEAALAAARDEAHCWLVQHGRHLLPHLFEASGGLRYERLVVPIDAAEGRIRFNRQYFRQNSGLPHRYITSFAGTIGARIRPDRAPAHNLVLAGDWTDNGLNAGALDAAVTSGRMAARAILRASGVPGADYRIYGEDDDSW